MLTYRWVAELAFKSLGKRARISSVPVGIVKVVIAFTGIFSRQPAGLLAFFVSMMTSDMIAPVSGTHTLTAHFKEQEEKRVSRF